ncbi:hypothetical protein PIB30_057040 [Stylosanthes scabra]|uniref:Uncharacterized protein n=1 Tax=Stylosanthes scabra TaxID=79078 RepID=A0ABU6UJ16_9FABA|nr:hypothetical protein [Stylosanthes scabra]
MIPLPCVIGPVRRRRLHSGQRERRRRNFLTELSCSSLIGVGGGDQWWSSLKGSGGRSVTEMGSLVPARTASDKPTPPPRDTPEKKGSPSKVEQHGDGRTA